MTNVAVIGSNSSEILSACQITVANLAKGGHRTYAIIASEQESESPPSPSPEAANIPPLDTIGIAQTFSIDRFDYSAITQANADAVNSIIKNIKPSLVIMPSWKSPNPKRKILARSSLIACRGIGSILMYELDASNTSLFNPTVIFEADMNRSLNQEKYPNNNNNYEDDNIKEISGTTTTVTDQNESKEDDTFTNKSTMLQQEKLESHRTLLLEDEGLF
jgi:hypothetical protein